MRLDVLRGRVFEGREREFEDLARHQAADAHRAPGMIAFMAGYRRVRRGQEPARSERVLLVSSWDDAAHAQPIAGRPFDDLAQELAGVVQIEQNDTYELIPPVFRGALDTPGAVIRLADARLLPGRREELLRWLRVKDREVQSRRWLMAWAMGERTEADGSQALISASAWASPLLIEQFGEAGRPSGASLFAELDDFVTDFRTESYQAIELRLASQLAHGGARRIIAARFDSEAEAQAARSALIERVGSATEAGISIARLGSQSSADHEPRILVARVSLADYPDAARVVADLDGQVIVAHDDLVPDQSETDQPPLAGPEALATT